MRSSQPIPGNPWPHDMIITIENDLQTLEEILWLREAYGLQCWRLEFPPPLVDSPVRLSVLDRPSDIAEWQAAWPGVWEACLAHAGKVRDETLFEKLRGTGLGAPERARLLAELVGPSWRNLLGDGAFTSDYSEWSGPVRERRIPDRNQSYDESPERKSLAALVPAWEAGLVKVVAIPCRGSFTRRVGKHALLVTEETRDDAARYSAALRAFP